MVSLGGKYLHGALVEFMPTFLIPVPNVILFQYNPETITHSWTQPETAPPPGAGGQANPLAVKGLPGESFSFTIAVDANDTIADGNPVAAATAALSGVYSRLAALEMLQYPTPSPPASTAGAGLVGSASASAGAGGISIGGSSAAQPDRPVPQSQLPTVLFVWGPGRILPVRVTNLSITEKLYDSLLNPTHAEATLGLTVLTSDELKFVTGPLAGIARTAYSYSLKQRQVLAALNLANAVDSIIGMLPI